MAPKEEASGGAGQACDRPAPGRRGQAQAQDGGGARWRLPAGGAGGGAALGGSPARLGLLGLRAWRYRGLRGGGGRRDARPGPWAARRLGGRPEYYSSRQARRPPPALCLTGAVVPTGLLLWARGVCVGSAGGLPVALKAGPFVLRGASDRVREGCPAVGVGSSVT